MFKDRFSNERHLLNGSLTSNQLKLFFSINKSFLNFDRKIMRRSNLRIKLDLNPRLKIINEKKEKHTLDRNIQVVLIEYQPSDKFLCICFY